MTFWRKLLLSGIKVDTAELLIRRSLVRVQVGEPEFSSMLKTQPFGSTPGSEKAEKPSLNRLGFLHFWAELHARQLTEAGVQARGFLF
ncbi:hypothetical protein ACN9MZ_21575 [Pseudoduganella sp. S-14]|jgi:hypothetical protein|uniref:hypothetical protein n=1 Tax=Pseudoduganella sp. S-14 TaxID=3404065 RepID=UPI003CE74A7E